ncbi:putative ABC-type amino acid transport, signal transduction system, domain protein [Desulfosarcina cetonica]|uniref:HD domain-containing phosphohydrolase n=1 Tax=Desulfosarcina cetonica TaxID=90730 RepID=UPI000B0C600A|nr:HD domain-containing phosphohydrolase [Desulfosarcina cetonica]VTR68420.1 putative ABC-type amino acid transport, signal transduction system, domain protein [Desulfosarcina cetonica]
MAIKMKRYPFYVGITTLIVAIVVSLTALFLWISHRESRAAAIQLADRLFSEVNEKVLERYENTLASVAVLAGSAAHMQGMHRLPVGGGLTHPGTELMLEFLSFYDDLFSTYAGYADGSFIQLMAVRNHPGLLKLFDAPPGTFYVLRTISENADGKLQQHWHFLNAHRQVTGARPDLDPDYDPRTRPWYIRARREPKAFFTQPYVFSSTGLPGITCAQRLAAGGGVFGADITLDRFTQSLKQQNVSANGVLFLFDRDGRIIAHPGIAPIRLEKDRTLTFPTAKASGQPLVEAIVADYRENPARALNRTHEMQIDGVTYLVRSTALKASLKFDHILATVSPLSDFTSHIRQMRRRVFYFSLLMLVLVIPLTLLVSRKITGSLSRLVQASEKIRRRDFSESAAFDSNIKEIHTLILAFSLMKRTIRRLLDQQRKLFDDFTKLIAGAIDAKSPYTGGHCARVPILAQMIADAACRAESGPFADFSMTTEDQRREFEVAAWLHDCGKITTPEYVVDKATKLETIYNRIHEIRMRFEVLLRDAEIDTYRKRLAGEGDEAALQAELAANRKKIADDFAFVAQCNIGGEFMDDEKIARLRRIASRTWTRCLDDRLGISPEEARLKPATRPCEVPVVEPVLADKPEHVVPRPDSTPFGDNPHGFTMDVPENLYNQGELYNLSIRKGTLSPEDRFKINEHIIQTIIMLNQLAFPEYLNNVAEFAGAHHETMDGTGYPRGLKREEMPVPARMIAIADIFEALTASDRPYKKSKTISETLAIMSVMRDDRQIDADLFDLFLESGIHRRYAERYLAPELNDAVDIGKYVSRSKQRP